MITEEQKQKVLKALRDSYANLTAEHTTEKEFENIIEAMEIVKKLTLTDVSQQRELLEHFCGVMEFDIKHNTYEEDIDYFLQNYRSSNCG